VAAEGKTREFDEARELLLGWLEYAKTTKRRQSPKEGPPELTNRFLPLEAGLALELLGEQAAAELVWVPLAARDECERAMQRCYDVRREHYRQRHYDPGWPNAESEQIVGGVPSFDRYFVERLLEVSFLLSPFVRPCAGALYFAREGHEPVTELWPRRFLEPTPGAEGLREAHVDGLGHSRGLQPIRIPIVAASTAGIAHVRSAIKAASDSWPEITDYLNTNDHYCVHAVEVFSTVAFAIAQSVNPIPLLDSPPAAMS
jgi:hypothetical protein